MTQTSLKTAGSWALYDFANTIFSAVVLTAFFPLYFTDLAGSNKALGLLTTASMILAGLFVPFFGALSDQTGKTKVYLMRATLLCVAFMACLGFTENRYLLMTCFIIACFCFHASLVFYNSLLSVSAPPQKQGFLSGLGTGLGYLGVVLILPLAGQVESYFGTKAIFPVTAALFLIAALPLFRYVPERAVSNPIFFKWALWKVEWQKVISLLKSLPETPKLLLFFAGNFFILDALNSMIFWFMVYAREVFSPEKSQLISLMMGVNIAAFLAGILLGLFTDKKGAMKILLFSAGILTLTLIFLAIVSSFTGFILGSLLGGAVAIAGIWTAGRKVLIELAPEDKLGEYFGIYGLTTKISVLGSLLFSIIADSHGMRFGLWALVFPAGLGFLLLLFSARLKK